MNDDPPHPIDALVRRTLERETADLDTAALVARIRQHSQSRRRPTIVRVFRWGVGVTVTIAASIALLLFWPSPDAAVQAQPSAEAVVREMQDALPSQPADRFYIVRTEWDANFAVNRPFLQRFRESRLWTRGDRFWIESPPPPAALRFGRDETGQHWFLHDRPWLGARNRAALLLEKEELTDPQFLYLSDLMTLRLDMLLRDLPAAYTLSREPVPDHPDWIRIRGVLKPGFANRRTKLALVDVDPKSKIVQRLEFQQPGVTVTFRLREVGTLPDERYRLEGHMEAGSQLIPRHAPFRSEAVRKILAGRFGVKD